MHARRGQKSGEKKYYYTRKYISVGHTLIILFCWRINVKKKRSNLHQSESLIIAQIQIGPSRHVVDGGFKRGLTKRTTTTFYTNERRDETKTEPYSHSPRSGLCTNCSRPIDGGGGRPKKNNANEGLSALLLSPIWWYYCRPPKAHSRWP